MPRALTILATLCTLAGALITPLDAATYYVRTGGSDGHSCSQAQSDSDGTAKASIQAGVRCVQGPGDTVIVHGGNYGSGETSVETPAVNGSPRNPITVRNASGETVWVLGGLYMWNGASEYWVIDGIHVDASRRPLSRDPAMLVERNSEIRNLEVKGAPYYGVGLGEHTRVFNVNSHHHGAGANSYCLDNPSQQGGQCHAFYFRESHVTVEQSRGCDNQGWGVTTNGVGHVVRNNVWCRNNPGGIQLFGSGTGTFYNNIMYGNGIAIWAGRGDYYHNTIFGNTTGLLTASGNEQIFRNNIIYGNGENITGGTIATSSNNLCNARENGCTLVGDPRFVSAATGDFHLRPSSPAVNAGLTIDGVSDDFDHAPRPHGGQPDIGAYEYGSTAGGPVAPVGRLPIPGNFRIVFK